MSPKQLSLNIVIAISEHPMHVNSKSAKCEFLKKNGNFKTIGHKCIIPSVLVVPEQMHNCAKYESSKSNYVDRRGKWRKKSKMAAILKVYAICTKYLMCITGGICANMCKIWSFFDQICSQEDCPQITTTQDDDTRWTIHDSIGSLALMPIEPTNLATVHLEKCRCPWLLL